MARPSAAPLEKRHRWTCPVDEGAQWRYNEAKFFGIRFGDAKFTINPAAVRRISRHTTKALIQSVRARAGMAIRERLNTRRISKSKRIDALVVITSDKDRGAFCDKTVDKIQIHRIQVLKFIYN